MAKRRAGAGGRARSRSWADAYGSLVQMEDPVSWPVNETSQPIELLLSVARDGDRHARRADRGPAPPRDPRRRAAARRARAVDARPRAPARRLAARRRRRLRAARRRGLPEPAAGRPAARRPSAAAVARGDATPRRRAPAPPPRYDFRPSVPDVSTFPRDRVAALAARGARDDRRTPTSATATRAASTRCAPRSPTTSAACAAWSPTRRASSSRAATRRGSASSAARSRRGGARRIALEDPSNPEQA